MQGLSGVLLHVGTLDLDTEDLAVDLDVEAAVVADRLVVLRGLVILRHVRVEVVLPGHAAPLGDLAVEGQTDADGRLDGVAVDGRHRSGKTQADRADVGVGILLGVRGTSAEHLGRRRQLDVDLESDDRLVVSHHLVIGQQLVRHHAFPLSSGAFASSGAPHFSFSSRSRAAPTR